MQIIVQSINSILLHEQATKQGEINMNTHRRYWSQSGAVSLFVVIFSALLLTIITISFVQLMVKDQRQATANDLSQSAYDSAQAGVEDAKRLLLLDQSCRNGTAAPTVNCGQIAAALALVPGTLQTACNTLGQSGIVNQTGGETIIQQTTTDNAAKLDQAYTCVKIAVDTADYLGQLQNDESVIIPLKGDRAFSKIELSWFSDQDLSGAGNMNIAFPDTGANVTLPRVGSKWKTNSPALMRAQLIQLGGTFKLSDLDTSAGGGRSDANTLFLYPSVAGLPPGVDKDFLVDVRRDPSNAPQPIQCKASLAGGGYACQVSLKVPDPVDGNVNNRNAFLRLSALYNKAHFQIKLKDSAGGDVKFSGVQPEVDSTGRANDLFRRVVARVELRGDFAYPNAEINLTGNLCKNFSVTDTNAGYTSSATCLP
jgi:Tfp pilus assembly protein PilX